MRRTAMPSIILLLLVLGACGNGDDNPATPDGPGPGELLIGQDCPDECIPRCHFEALSAIGNCMPAGTSQRNVDVRCYENGVIEHDLCNGNGTVYTFYMADGEKCLYFSAFYGGLYSCSEPASWQIDKFEHLELSQGPREQLLVDVMVDPAMKNKVTFTCSGMQRTVDLLVNKTNPACSKCPEDYVSLPIPPLPSPTPGDATCHVP